METRNRQIVSTKKNALKNGSSDKAGDDIERRIIALEEERGKIERSMNEAYSAGDLKKARDLGTKLAETARRIDRLYESWVSV